MSAPAKLTISSFKKADRSDSPTVVSVQFNPETVSIRHEIVYDRPACLGPGSGQEAWIHNGPKTLKVDLIFDGTAATASLPNDDEEGPGIAARVKTLIDICFRVDSETHEPPYLRLTWHEAILGTGGLDCRLESADVRYTLFRRDGMPLRAEIAASFVEKLDPKKKAAQQKLSSPDLSHRRRVRDGDTLPLMCIDIYGSAAHYLRVAEANGLDDFRVLEPGRELVFPPFERA